MDRGAWRAAVHGVTKSQTRLKQLSARARKTALFDDLLEGLTEKLSPSLLWFTAVKGHKSQPAENTGAWDRVQEKPGGGSSDALWGGTALSQRQCVTTHKYCQPGRFTRATVSRAFVGGHLSIISAAFAQLIKPLKLILKAPKVRRV